MRKQREIEEWILRNLRYRKRALISEQVVRRYGGEKCVLSLLESNGYPCIMKKRKPLQELMKEQFYDVELI